MKVKVGYTFLESLEKLAWYDSKLYRFWELITKKIPLFFANIWRFRKELYSHQWWDYTYTLQILRRSLIIMVDKLEKDGIEEDVSRGKKVAKIKRAIELLNHKIDDDYIERAEAELGKLIIHDIDWLETEDGNFEMIGKETKSERAHNVRVYKKSQQIEDSEWKELWKIFKGQDLSKFKKSQLDWNDWFDGSDMRGWWD
jgi:hypothetical protein